jgi:general secretion pathway protein J
MTQTSGFTLLEVLVVLMIISLAVTLLIQGLSSVLQIRQKVRDNLLATKPAILQQTFLRTLLSSMASDDIKGKHRFTGTAQKITGFSLAPLLSPQGVPVLVELHIEQKDEACTLHYAEPGSPSLLLGTWQQSRCHFSYLADEKKMSVEWVPPAGELIQLPSGIAFHVENTEGDQVFYLFAAIQGRKLARFYIADYFDSDSI